MKRSAVGAVVILLVTALVLYGALANLAPGTQTVPSSSSNSSSSQRSTTVQSSTTPSSTSVSSSTSQTSVSSTKNTTSTGQPEPYAIADSALAEGVDANYQPINRTQAFDASDVGAYSWVHFTNVYSPSHNVTWAWITPWAQVYFRYPAMIPDPGNGRYYTNWYVYDSIGIKGYNALYLAGNWHVDVYVDGSLALVQNFTLQSPYIPPQGIRGAYNVNPLIRAGYDGRGVTVAIINSGIDSTFYSDVNGFDTAFGLPAANISVVEPNGPQGTNVETPQGELTGDVEFVHAMAPEAHILLVLVGSIANFYSGFSYVIDNNLADVASVSPSWAWWGQGNQATVTAENNEFAKGAQENITLIAASNDWGSNDTVPWPPGYNFSGGFWATHLPYAWLMPQFSPYFTAVGGTALTLSNGQYAGEVGWNQSGGGPSNIFAQPSWQTGDGVPSNGYRDIPDISLDASCATGYSFYWNGHPGYFCGTSGGAPTFAGIVADMVQAAGHRLGLLNPGLYSLAVSDPTAFHDITSGCSLVETSSGPQTGYCPKPGWDYVTGLGSPDAVKLLGALAHVSLATIDGHKGTDPRLAVWRGQAIFLGPMSLAPLATSTSWRKRAFGCLPV